MSELIAIAYPDRYRANEVMATLNRLQMEHLVDLEDACVVTRDSEGQVKLHQTLNLTTTGALSGAFWGTLIGTLFLSPLIGLAVGAATGAAAGSLSDIGVNDEFMRRLGESLSPNSSAIFVLLRKATPERFEQELAKYGGTVLRTSLTREQEDKLQATLDQGGLTLPGASPLPPLPSEITASTSETFTAEGEQNRAPGS